MRDDFEQYRKEIFFETQQIIAFGYYNKDDVVSIISSSLNHLKNVKRKMKYDSYDILYKNVYCSAVKWCNKIGNTYIFEYYGKRYKYHLSSKIYTISDTDNIRIAIDLFLNEIIKKCYKCMYCGCPCGSCKYE